MQASRPLQWSTLEVPKAARAAFAATRSKDLMQLLMRWTLSWRKQQPTVRAIWTGQTPVGRPDSAQRLRTIVAESLRYISSEQEERRMVLLRRSRTCIAQSTNDSD